MFIFRRIFLRKYWWQKSDIWSQALYRYPISWKGFFTRQIPTSCLLTVHLVISSNFDMYCGSCENIPFWRWLKETQKYPTSITCKDFDRKYLPSLQLNNVTDCSGEYLCTWFWKCYQIYCIYINNIDPLFYAEKFEDTKEVIRSLILRTDNTMAKRRRANTDR